MALISMTGFGRGHAAAKGFDVDIELGSVNRKQFDARITLPRFASALEPRILALLRERVSRGQASVTLKIASTKGQGSRFSIDVEAAAALLNELRAAAKALDIPFDVTTASLLRMPDVMRVESDSEPELDQLWPVVAKATRQAIKELIHMRKQEGLNLQTDLEKRITRLTRLRGRVATRAPKVPQRHRKDLMERLKASNLEIDLTDSALQRDLILFADRSDVTEELVRLESHIEQFTDMLGMSKPVGRALDFLCQEMFREINTIGSKANDGPVASLVIQMKTELEAVREQVQNVE